MDKRRFVRLVCIICAVCACVFDLGAGNKPDEKEPEIRIEFEQPGAVYLKNERIKVAVEIDDPSTTVLRIEMLDVDMKTIGKPTYLKKKDAGSSSFDYEFKERELGYYYLKITDENSGKSAQEGFGVIPDVRLTKKDWDSPFGICGHYQRYKDWRVGDVQQKLGIAWVRDEADWQGVAQKGLARDPYLEYLNSKNICWLALFNYVNSYNGVQGADSIWKWDEDVSMIKEYVKKHKGDFHVYESQNEPNNFGGWSKRWPHPQNQQWRPHGWGKPFADLIKQMHDSIKAIDPTLKLMWPGEEEWIEYFVEERGAAPYIDVTCIHPYVNKGKYPETSSFANGEGYKEMRDELSRLKVPTEIWATELGWSTYKTDGEPERYMPVTEVEQAAFLWRSYLLHLYNGAEKVFWYEMVDEDFGAENPESYFGLLRFNSKITVKPAAVAYSNLIHNYRHAKVLGRFFDREVYGFAYSNKGNSQLCLWTEKESKNITLNLKKTKQLILTDIFGREKKLKVENGTVHINVGFSPLTIKGIDKRDMEGLYIP